MSQLTRTARKKKNIGHPERRTLFFRPRCGNRRDRQHRKKRIRCGLLAIAHVTCFRLASRMHAASAIAPIARYRLAASMNAAGPHRA
jgi:hypothetical protein